MTFRQTIECGFAQKLVRDMIIRYSQMCRTDKNSQHSSVIWLIWLNGYMFVYKLSACEFESRCCHLFWFSCQKISDCIGNQISDFFSRTSDIDGEMHFTDLEIAEE